MELRRRMGMEFIGHTHRRFRRRWSPIDCVFVVVVVCCWMWTICVERIISRVSEDTLFFFLRMFCVNQQIESNQIKSNNHIRRYSTVVLIVTRSLWIVQCDIWWNQETRWCSKRSNWQCYFRSCDSLQCLLASLATQEVQSTAWTQEWTVWIFSKPVCWSGFVCCEKLFLQRTLAHSTVQHIPQSHFSAVRECSFEFVCLFVWFFVFLYMC